MIWAIKRFGQGRLGLNPSFNRSEIIMQPTHIHAWDDGRGLRDVFLNGAPADKCIFADTKKGKVVCYHPDLKLDKRKKRILTKTLYGKVEVKPKSANPFVN